MSKLNKIKPKAKPNQTENSSCFTAMKSKAKAIRTRGPRSKGGGRWKEVRQPSPPLFSFGGWEAHGLTDCGRQGCGGGGRMRRWKLSWGQGSQHTRSQRRWTDCKVSPIFCTTFLWRHWASLCCARAEQAEKARTSCWETEREAGVSVASRSQGEKNWNSGPSSDPGDLPVLQSAFQKNIKSSSARARAVLHMWYPALHCEQHPVTDSQEKQQRRRQPHRWPAYCSYLEKELNIS